MLAAPSDPQPDTRPSRLAFSVVAAHALLSPLVLWSGSEDAFERPKIALLHSAALALLGIGASHFVARAASDEPLPRLPRDLASWAALAVLASALASTLASASPITSVFGAERSHLGLLSIASCVVLFFATRACASDARMRRGILIATLAGAAGACAYALAQMAGVDWLAWSPRWALTSRPFGPLGNPNFLGAYLAAIAPLGAWSALAAARAGRPVAAWGLAGLAALFAALCVLSLSRGAWLGRRTGYRDRRRDGTADSRKSARSPGRAAARAASRSRALAPARGSRPGARARATPRRDALRQHEPPLPGGVT